ncbi:MAG: PEP-CTERM sorting domain-containing protein [Planctomycetes bacterium]|nr:PEP-CTERM sorting domain-containing protein [Planctomycetota bacterium]
MFKKIATYGLVALIALGNVPLAFAAHVNWDDAGNSASKLWDNNGNWSPDGDPDGLDVFIGNLANAANDRTLVDRAYSINSLTITNGADVVNSTTNGVSDDFELLVNGATSVSGAGSSIIIYGGDPDGLDTNTLTVSNGGSLILNSTSNSGTAVVEVDSGLFEIGSSGSLIGTGRIDLENNPGSATTLLSNDGTITANTTPFFLGGTPAAGTLQITATSANARFDWDGTAPITAVMNVNGNQTLDIDVDTGNDAWSGTMNLSTGSTIDIADAWAMDSGTINVNTSAFGFILPGQDPNPGAAARIAGANWTMSGGTINILDSWDSLQLDSQLVASGGTIENSGTMIFNGGATIQSGVNFDMNGSAASLVINSTVNIDTPDFNLDGTGSAGNVTTINAGGNLDLDLGVGADEDFNHTININGGELDVTTADNDWNLQSNGEINAAGGATSTINGETFNINGDINVTANSTLQINANSAYSGTADVVVEAGSILNQATTTYAGGSYTGGGVLKKGTATILSDTTWNVSTVDIDDGSTTINNGAALVINTDSIDDFGDGIDATITVADTGRLTLGLNDGSDVVFDNAGRLVYNGNIISSTFLQAPASGSALVFNSGSQMNINGDGTSNARIELNGGTLNINDVAEDFRMNGGSQIVGSTNEISGGTINGPGELQIASGRALRGNGTINAQVDGDGTAELIASAGTLMVNGGIQDIGTIGTSGGAAVLHVTDPWNTNVTQAVVLDRGRIQGSTITNDGVNGIVGRGSVIARVNNNSLIQANGGTLVVENNLNDWDGSANTGTLRASNSTLELRDNASFLFNGTVEANSGTVFASGFELEFDPGSMLRLSNGTYRSGTATDFGGDIEVLAGATSIIQVTASSTFENTSTTTLGDTLRLENGQSFVEVGATFVGGGALFNAGGHVLTLEDGANVGVLVQNEGRLALGASPGQATVLDYQQEAAGLLEIELEGTGLNEFDRLTATGLAQLDGFLELSLLGGFNPTLSDTFTILSAAAGVNGVFSALDFSAAVLDPGLMWDVIYNPTNVQLEVVSVPSFSADFDNDGDVDGDDLAQWEGDYGGPGSDADADGDSDGSDFLAWQQQNGSGLPAAAVASAVPEPSTLLLAGLAACFGLLVPRRKK